MSSIIRKIISCGEIFYISTDNLHKAEYFKHADSFHPLEMEDVIYLDFEPDIFKYIIEHMKYDNITDKLCYTTLKKYTRWLITYNTVPCVRII